MMKKPERRPVTMVSGVPRSGTSLMMRMLQAGGLELLTDGARRPDADNPAGYFEYEPVKGTEQDASWVTDAEGKVVKIVHLLVRHLPRDRAYRIVLMRRNLDEVVASQRIMLDRLGAPRGELDERRVAEIFNSQLDDLERWAIDQPCFSLLRVEYSELVADPDGQARAVDEFLGGGLDTAAMAAIVDPSQYRQRR